MNKYLARYGIYITNNGMKIHGITAKRCIAGRKRVRKPKPQKQSKAKGIKNEH